MIFSNREQAARLLADKLAAYKGKNPLILAIPRGAVPMAKIVAEALGGEFDVVRMEAEIFVAHVERITAVMWRRFQADNVFAEAGALGEAMVAT